MLNIVLNRRNSPYEKRREIVIGSKKMNYCELQRLLSIFQSLYESTDLEVFFNEKIIALENKKYEVRFLIEDESYKHKILSFVFREKKFEEFLPMIFELISEAKELITKKKGGE